MLGFLVSWFRFAIPHATFLAFRVCRFLLFVVGSEFFGRFHRLTIWVYGLPCTSFKVSGLPFLFHLGRMGHSFGARLFPATLLGLRICNFPLLLDSGVDLFRIFRFLVWALRVAMRDTLRVLRCAAAQFWDGGLPLATCFGFRACYCLLSLGSGLNMFSSLSISVRFRFGLFWKVFHLTFPLDS